MSKSRKTDPKVINNMTGNCSLRVRNERLDIFLVINLGSVRSSLERTWGPQSWLSENVPWECAGRGPWRRWLRCVGMEAQSGLGVPVLRAALTSFPILCSRGQPACRHLTLLLGFVAITRVKHHWGGGGWSSMSPPSQGENGCSRQNSHSLLQERAK